MSTRSPRLATLSLVLWTACGGGASDDAADATDALPAADAGAPDAAPLDLGDACTDDSRCGSGHCVTDVCCATACDGACETGACTAEGACELVGQGVVCRPGVDACDPAETCDGGSPTCPEDAIADEGVVCRDAAGDCDVAEQCTGTDVACPADALATTDDTCGAYQCTGADVTCPTSCDGHDACAADALCVGHVCTPARWAFSTSIGTNGNIGGILGADAFCQARADAAGLRGTYKAWLSDSSGSPSTRFTQSTVPWVLPIGTTSAVVLADDWADLTDGTIDALFVRTEFGVDVPHNIPFTNTKGDGTHWNGNDCSDWTSTAGTGAYGNTGGLDVGWTQSGTGGPCTVVHRIYCFEQ